MNKYSSDEKNECNQIQTCKKSKNKVQDSLKIPDYFIESLCHYFDKAFGGWQYIDDDYFFKIITPTVRNTNRNMKQDQT